MQRLRSGLSKPLDFSVAHIFDSLHSVAYILNLHLKLPAFCSPHFGLLDDSYFRLPSCILKLLTFWSISQISSWARKAEGACDHEVGGDQAVIRRRDRLQASGRSHPLSASLSFKTGLELLWTLRLRLSPLCDAFVIQSETIFKQKESIKTAKLEQQRTKSRG